MGGVRDKFDVILGRGNDGEYNRGLIDRIYTIIGQRNN